MSLPDAPRQGPAPTAIGRALARLAQPVYRAAIARVNRRFDAGRGVLTLDRPVISVGNLSVGGTGKTPMVMHVLRLLRDAGHRPCVAMRGYGARPGPDGRTGESDEAQEYRRAMPDVPIIAQANRFEGLLDLFATPAGTRVDSIVLDDGFQHRKIARQLDIVLIDATRPPFADELLPAGWLREPVESLRRAQAIVLTHAESVSESTLKAIEGRVRQIVPQGDEGPIVSRARHEWARLRVMEPSGATREEPVEWLRGRRVFVACAIGNPEAFLAEVDRRTGGPRAGTLVLRDHDPYAVPTIARLLDSLREASIGSNAAVVVTEKDWSKLRYVKPSAWPCAVVVPELVMSGAAGLETLIMATMANVPE